MHIRNLRHSLRSVVQTGQEIGMGTSTEAELGRGSRGHNGRRWRAGQSAG
jgi:hypothetical protein